MATAAEIRNVAPGVLAWSAFEPAVKCDLWSTALETPAGLIVIDPIELAPAALAELAARGRIAAVILTNGNHARDAEAFRMRGQVPIWAPRAAAGEFPFQVDCQFSEGDTLLSGITVVGVPSAGPGEVALIAQGLLCFGDAVINFASTGFSLLPAKYCANPRELPNDLRKLLSYDFRILTFAHGDPMVEHAKERLHTLLA